MLIGGVLKEVSLSHATSKVFFFKKIIFVFVCKTLAEAQEQGECLSMMHQYSLKLPPSPLWTLLCKR